MSKNPPSFRFPFASLGKLPPEAQAAHLATFNALTDIYQAIAQQKQNSTTNTTTVNETVQGTSGTGSAAGVTSFNGEKGSVTFFPDLFFVNNQSGVSAYTTQDSDNGALIVLNDASPIAVGLNYNVATNWATWIANYGSGTATLTPSNVPSGVTSTISYPGNLAASSMPLASGFAAFVFFDGTNFFAIPVSITGGATGVSQIIAGTNITISPAGGTGAVTINATGSSTYSLGGALSTSNVALGAGAGTGATLVAVAGLDGSHQIEITIGTGPTIAAIWTTTFTATRGHVTYPQIQCVAVTATDTFIEVGSPGGSATTYAAYADPGITPATGVTYIFNISAP